VITHLKLSTSRFGTIDIQEDQIIHVPSGMIGFPDSRRFTLLEHKKGSPFWWLQSADDGSLAFVLIDPLLCKPDYEIKIDAEDKEALRLPDASNGIVTFVVVNISPVEPFEITVNLLGPLVINVQKKLGRQIALSNPEYSHRHPIPLKKNEKAP
jgi:flagellar assembly factor FliW